jgi:hypothetical protein
MYNLEKYLLVIWLAVLGGTAVLYFLSTFFISRRRIVCPACGNKSLRCVQWIRMTVLVEGKKVPDNRKYFQCGSCDARFKQLPDANFIAAPEDEWRRHCESKW